MDASNGVPDADPRGRAGRGGLKPSWVRRRREKVISEIERNRRGDYTVPTWALVAILVVVTAAWVTVIAIA